MDSTRLFDLPICVIDVETTGASFGYGDRIVEIGAVRLERGQVVQTYQQLINPGRPISGGAAAVTGITNAMLVGQPTFCDIWSIVRAMLRGAVVVGHNVAFDIGFFDGECRRAGETLAGEIGDYPVLDTVRIARKQFGRGGNGLQRLASRLEIAVDTAHRALADCHTTAKVLEQLLIPHGGWEVTLGKAISLQGGATKPRPDPTLKSIIPDEVATALVAGQPVVITYLDATNRRSQRTVTPMFVRRISGTMTLVAQCHLRNEQRMFKLKRILAASPVMDEVESVTRSIEPELPVMQSPSQGRALIDHALKSNLLMSGSALAS